MPKNPSPFASRGRGADAFKPDPNSPRLIINHLQLSTKAAIIRMAQKLRISNSVMTSDVLLAVEDHLADLALVGRQLRQQRIREGEAIPDIFELTEKVLRHVVREAKAKKKLEDKRS